MFVELVIYEMLMKLDYYLGVMYLLVINLGMMGSFSNGDDDKYIVIIKIMVLVFVVFFVVVFLVNVYVVVYCEKFGCVVVLVWLWLIV